MPTDEYEGFFNHLEKLKQCSRRAGDIQCACTSVEEEGYPMLALQLGGAT